MSVSLVLVPVAFAAIAAWQASRPEQAATETGVLVQHVQTRMRDEHLLTVALSDTGALVARSDDELVADWSDVRACFSRGEDGIWKVDFTGAVDAEQAASIVTAVDTAYGLQVQRTVLARLRERAPSAGMAVESEMVEADQSVTLVLTQGAR